MRRICVLTPFSTRMVSRNLQLPDSSSNVSGEYRWDSLFSFVSYSLVDWAAYLSRRSLLLVDCEKGLTKAPMHIEIIIHCMNCFTATVCVLSQYPSFPERKSRPPRRLCASITKYGADSSTNESEQSESLTEVKTLSKKRTRVCALINMIYRVTNSNCLAQY